MGRVQLQTDCWHGIYSHKNVILCQKKGGEKHHQFNDSYYIHIYASSCKVVGQMEFEMCLASLPVWRKWSSVLWLSMLLNFHLEQQCPSHNWTHAALAGVTGGPHWWQVVWGRAHSSVSLTSSSCLVGCCLQSCQIPKMSLLAPRPVLQAIGAQPQWVFEHSNQIEREPCKINGWFPEHQCKWGARNHLNIMHSHRCDRTQFYFARARHMVALVITLVSTQRDVFSLSFVYALKKTKQNKCCQYSFSTTGPLQAAAPCSQALCTLPSLWNLSGLLMRLIKPSPEFV